MMGTFGDFALVGAALFEDTAAEIHGDPLVLHRRQNRSGLAATRIPPWRWRSG
jgi:hypothetical protein